MFRKEAIEARRTSWLGSISLVQPMRAWILVGVSVASAMAAASLLYFCSYTHRASVSGQLVPTLGLSMVQVPTTGVVSRVEVTEGQRVRRGQLLGVVTVPRATESGGDTLAELQRHIRLREDGVEASERAQLKQLDLEAAGLDRQLRAAHSEITQIRAAIETRRRQVALATEVLSRWKNSEKEGFVSVLQITQQETNVLEYTSQMQSLERELTEMERSAAQMEQQIATMPSRREGVRATYSGDLAALKQESLETQASATLAIRAPISGIVATQLVKVGQAIGSNQSFASLLPDDTRLEAELFVSSRDVGFIKAGDEVKLRYQAYPYQKFGHQLGLVKRIGRTALNPTEMSAPAGALKSNEPYYLVTVSVPAQSITAYGKSERLRPGMLIDADIMGESRRLFEWVFEPMYSISD